MTLNIKLQRQDGDGVTLVQLHNVVFEGGEPAIGVLVRCDVDNEELVAAVRSVEHEPTDPPGTSTVMLERVDERILTEDQGITFLGAPPHAAAATSTLDLADPRHLEPDKNRVY